MTARRLRRVGIGLVCAAGAAALVGAGLGCGLVAAVVVAPHPSRVGPPPDDLGAEPVRIASAAGQPLAGWWVEAADPAAPAVVLLHGVTDSRRRLVPRARMLREAGYAVLLVDGRGHGESPREAVGYGWRERHDAAAAVAFVRAARPGTRVGVVGISLGGAGAALAGERLGADAVVLESVFPTFDAAAGNRVRRFLGPAGPRLLEVVRPSLEARLEAPFGTVAPLAGVPRLGAPVLVAGGSRDPFTPPAETRALFEAAPAPRALWIADGAGHVDLLRHDPAGYRAHVVAFLDRHLRG